MVRWSRRRVALLALSFSSALAVPTSPAAAQRVRNPHDAEVARHVAEARRDARSPRAALSMLRISGQRDDATPGLVGRELGRLATDRRLSAANRSYAAALAAFAALRAGDTDGAARRFDELGYVRRWRIIGGFDDEGKQGFDRVMPPEEQRNAPAVADEVGFPGREREVRWRDYPEELTRYGYVDFDSALRPFENACGFAETFVRVTRRRPMSLWLGAGGAMKVWVNGDEVFRDSIYRGPDLDRSSTSFLAREGWNRILVKVCVQDREWGFYLRVAELDGGAPQGVEVDPRGALAASADAGPAINVPDAPEAPLAFFERRVRERAEDAAAHFDLARYLSWTSAEDPTETRSRQLAERAAELAPTVDHLLFASEVVETRAEVMRYVAKAEEIAPRDPRVRLARIHLVASGPDPGRALRMVEGFGMDSVPGMRAAWLHASLLEERGLRQTALAMIREGTRRTGGAPSWQGRLGRALDLYGRTEAAIEANAQLLSTDQRSTEVRYAIMNDAYERGELEVVFRHLDALRAIAPGNVATLRYAAEIFEGLGRHDEALDLYRQIIGFAPDEPSHHASYGRALLRIGQEGAAIEVFRQVLALSPQDAATRQLLERLQPREREDEAWATPTEQLLARRRDSRDWPVTMLHELQVATVFESGLSSTFHQVAFQVHDEEGARRMARYPVVFEPGRQWVEVRSAKVHRADGTVVENVRTFQQSLGDSRYRIYYDTRALVIDLPQLRPGDTVELRFRVEDVSRRNVFNDYYGAVRFLQGAYPTAHLEHVLVTPATRAFHFNRPGLRGLQHERRTVEGQNVDRFVATNLEPVRSEDSMPGPAETRPYLHVSTYRSWEDVGRWWWGLAKDQLIPDESLERTTRELVAGAPDTRTKVARIYDWVVRNTRYVGLEFGIHGFKPYRVTQVVRRGFGDCKDKASLLYAMFQIAGIDARIALIRTRRNGDIATEPASLAVFDHAIAYVPELDLFLDGTAETNGIDELPAMDQGVMTLLVGPESVELRRTPVLPPEREKRERTLEITLAADGSAEVSGREVVIGNAAAAYRAHYQAEGMRTERLQRELAGSFPGLELAEQAFEDLDDFNRPARFRWKGQVPQLAQRTGTRLVVPPSSLANLLSSLARAPTRRHALDLGPPRAYVEERVVRLPAGARLEPLPAGGDVDTPFGRLVVRYQAQGATVRVRTEWTTRRDRVSVEEYPAFRAFVERADALLRERVSLEVPARSASSASSPDASRALASAASAAPAEARAALVAASSAPPSSLATPSSATPAVTEVSSVTPAPTAAPLVADLSFAAPLRGGAL